MAGDGACCEAVRLIPPESGRPGGKKSIVKRNGICYNPFHGRARFRERAESRIHGKSEPAAPEEPARSQTHGRTAKGEII